MKNRVQKWGNSLAVRIPGPFARGLGLADNTPVLIGLEEGALVVRPDNERTWDLDALLAGVTDENIPADGETEMAAHGAGEGEEDLR